MLADRTDEKLLLDYVRAIMKATTKEELSGIDTEITFNDDISIKGYGLLMNVIMLKEETLK